MKIKNILLLWVSIFCASELNSMQCEVVRKVKNPEKVEDLLAKNGKYLKQLLAIEKSGTYEPKLHLAETTLHNFVTSEQESYSHYSDKTLRLGKFIAQRIDDVVNLQFACQKDDVDCVEKIVQANPYVLHGYNDWGQYPLSHAVHFNSALVTKKLLELKANPNACDTHGNAPLYYVTNIATAQMLIDHGAHVNQKNKKGQTPLFAYYHTIDQGIMELLLEKGAQVDAKDNDNNTVLYKAMKLYSDKKIIEILLQAGADPDSANHKGKTPLGLLCNKSLYNLYVQSFAKYGYLFFPSNPDCANPFVLLRNNAAYSLELSKRPLGCAEWEVAEESLRRLYDYIKDVIDKNFVSIPSSSRGILVNEHGCFIKQASSKACLEFFGADNLECIQKCIKTINGAKTTLEKVLDGGETSVMDNLMKEYKIDALYADSLMRRFIHGNNNHSLLMCLRYGFNPNGADLINKAPLLFGAIAIDNWMAFEDLLKFGADFIVRTRQHETPLDAMVRLGSDKCHRVWHYILHEKLISELRKTKHSCFIVKQLLESGVDRNKKDNYSDLTPLDYAQKTGCEKCIQLLTEHKSDSDKL